MAGGRVRHWHRVFGYSVIVVCHDRIVIILDISRILIYKIIIFIVMSRATIIFLSLTISIVHSKF